MSSQKHLHLFITLITLQKMMIFSVFQLTELATGWEHQMTERGHAE